MSGCTFTDFQAHDDSLVLCQEDSLKRLLAFSGILDVAATSLMDYDFASATGLDGNEEGTWSISSGKLQGIGDGSAGTWYKALFSTEVEPGFVVRFTKFEDRGGFLFQCDSTTQNGYMAWWDGTYVGVSKIVADVETVLHKLPCAETGEAVVTIGVWPLRYAGVDTIDDVAVGIWFDDKLLTTYIIDYDPYGKSVGFAVYEAETITFDDFRIPMFHQIVEWTSVDPGEAASAGMGRILGLDKLRVQARYDGSVYIFRNNATSVDWAIDKFRIVGRQRTVNLVPPNHLRFVGAIHEADLFATGAQGHIFMTGQDPNALSKADTELRGWRKLLELTEQADTTEFGLAPNPLLEAEDVISYDGTSYRVTSISYRVAWIGDKKSGVPALSSKVSTRGCSSAYSNTSSEY